MNVLAFGEVLWDVYSDKRVIGGASLNFAAHAAKHGHRVSLSTTVGADDEGDEAIRVVRNFGISTDYLGVNRDKQTGKCLVTLDEHAIPSYNLLSDVAYDYIDALWGGEEFDVLYFGTLALRSEYNLRSLQSILDEHEFKEIFVDLNIRAPFSTEEAVRFALGRATIVKVSDEELAFVMRAVNAPSGDYRTAARSIAERYPNIRCIVVTLGDKGAYALDLSRGIEAECPAQRVSVVSTVGAGDSFSASFLHKYHTTPLEHALTYAVRIAGYVVSHYDAVPDYDVADFE